MRGQHSVDWRCWTCELPNAQASSKCAYCGSGRNLGLAQIENLRKQFLASKDKQRAAAAAFEKLAVTGLSKGESKRESEKTEKYLKKSLDPDERAFDRAAALEMRLTPTRKEDTFNSSFAPVAAAFAGIGLSIAIAYMAVEGIRSDSVFMYKNRGGPAIHCRLSEDFWGCGFFSALHITVSIVLSVVCFVLMSRIWRDPK